MLIANILAQAAVAAAPAPAVAPQQQGVISYPVSFFAGQQVANANEMLARIPGFSLDTGDTVRGFEGAAGNVLIDGQRLGAKSQSLRDVLGRVAAKEVLRIEILRGAEVAGDASGARRPRAAARGRAAWR